VTSATLRTPTPISSEAGSQIATPLERISVRLAQVFLAAWALFYLVNALKAAFWFDGFPVNGPFQLYDPLRRLAAGQHAGQDFQFFHGIGVPFLHYPLFWLFGGDSLQASELSRQFTSFLLFAATTCAFAWATFRRSSARWIAAVAGVLVMEALFHRVAEPGHSFVSGRSAMPILVFALLQTRLANGLKGVLVGCCIACAFLFGTEHGISTSLALIAVCALSIVQSLFAKPFNLKIAFANVQLVVIALAVAALGATGLFIAFCGRSGALNAIHYNLVELPSDQFWFFGSPPMPYLKDLHELFLNRHTVLSFMPTYVLLTMLLVVVVVSWKKPLRLGADWQALACVMLVYGALTAIPLIGILSRHYAFPQLRIFIFVLFLLAANGAASPPFSRWWQAIRQRLPRSAGYVFPVICAVAAAALAYQSASTAIRLATHLGSTPAPYNKYLDEHWNAFMAGATQAIDANRTRKTISLWSEYAALLDAHYGSFQPAEDYIIHTVGPERWHRYTATFRATNPEFVTTMTSQFSFAEWLQDERWEFYEELLNNYRPLKQIEHDTLWQRKTGDWVEASQNFTTLPFQAGASSLTLPVAQGSDQIAVVRIQYKVTNPWRKLPLIGATPRYLVAVDGSPRNLTVSLPPYLTEFQFPVKLLAGQPVSLHFKTESFLPNAAMEVQEVRVKTIENEQPALDALFAQRILPSRY
jgi:hypothetical protein